MEWYFSYGSRRWNVYDGGHARKSTLGVTFPFLQRAMASRRVGGIVCLIFSALFLSPVLAMPEVHVRPLGCYTSTSSTQQVIACIFALDDGEMLQELRYARVVRFWQHFNFMLCQ